MPSDKTKNILKGFGEGVDVVMQEALSRGSRASGPSDISDGEVVEVPISGTSGSVQNPLGRTPLGAHVIDPGANNVFTTVWANDDEVQVTTHGDSTSMVKVWIF